MVENYFFESYLDCWISLEKINLNNQTNLKKDNDRLDRK